MFWRKKRVQPAAVQSSSTPPPGLPADATGVPTLGLAVALHRPLSARPGNLAFSPWSISVEATPPRWSGATALSQ